MAGAVVGLSSPRSHLATLNTLNRLNGRVGATFLILHFIRLVDRFDVPYAGTSPDKIEYPRTNSCNTSYCISLDNKKPAKPYDLRVFERL
jgi:hypothetical protein